MADKELKMEESTLTKFPNGAVRGKEETPARFDLISPVGLRRLAETYGEGALKYSEGNWLKGIDAKNLMNHALVHLNKYLSGDTSEDHLAHASWNLFAIMHFEETRPELINLSYKQGDYRIIPDCRQPNPSRRELIKIMEEKLKDEIAQAGKDLAQQSVEHYNEKHEIPRPEREYFCTHCTMKFDSDERIKFHYVQMHSYTLKEDGYLYHPTNGSRITNLGFKYK